MNDLQKVILICLFFIVLNLFIVEYTNTSVKLEGITKDYEHHLSYAQDPLGQDQYAPFFPVFSSAFSKNMRTFYRFSVLLLGLLLPLLLFFLTKRWESAFFYFASTEFFWLMSYSGFIPQALTIAYVLGLLLTKNWYARLGLVFLALLTHNFGFLFVLISLLIIAFFEKKQGIMIAGAVAACPPCNCSPVLGEKASFFKDKILGDLLPLSLDQVIDFFTKGMPLPLMFLSVKQLWKEKNFAVLSIIAFTFTAGMIWVYGDRVIFSTLPFLVIGLTNYYVSTNKKMRLVIVGICLITLCFNLYSFRMGSLISI